MQITLSHHLAEELYVLLQRLEVTLTIWDKDFNHIPGIRDAKLALAKGRFTDYGSRRVEVDDWDEIVTWLDQAEDIVATMGAAYAKRIKNAREALQDVYEDTREDEMEGA